MKKNPSTTLLKKISLLPIQPVRTVFMGLLIQWCNTLSEHSRSSELLCSMDNIPHPGMRYNQNSHSSMTDEREGTENIAQNYNPFSSITVLMRLWND